MAIAARCLKVSRVAFGIHHFGGVVGFHVGL